MCATCGCGTTEHVHGEHEHVHAHEHVHEHVNVYVDDQQMRAQGGFASPERAGVLGGPKRAKLATSP